STFCRDFAASGCLVLLTFAPCTAPHFLPHHFLVVTKYPDFLAFGIFVSRTSFDHISFPERL
ncbi:hypothetical protein V7S82_24205, partial [Enterobacter hormaechei subsp. steigerwaltii]|uniref:hypothetical protein n=1 Tax=Enterobacter hormaechei TaxID=158836 RepID=UPI00320479D2